jgi:hypothetical protein
MARDQCVHGQHANSLPPGVTPTFVQLEGSDW